MVLGLRLIKRSWVIQVSLAKLPKRLGIAMVCCWLRSVAKAGSSSFRRCSADRALKSSHSSTATKNPGVTERPFLIRSSVLRIAALIKWLFGLQVGNSTVAIPV